MKVFIEPYVSQKRTGSWAMWSEPPAAALNEDKRVHCPGVDRDLLYNEFGEERFKLFWKNYVGYK